MKVREVDRAIFNAECGRASHTHWAKPENQRRLRTKLERAGIGSASFQRRMVRVYDQRLRVLKAYRAQLVAAAVQLADGELAW